MGSEGVGLRNGASGSARDARKRVIFRHLCTKYGGGGIKLGSLMGFDFKSELVVCVLFTLVGHRPAWDRPPCRKHLCLMRNGSNWPEASRTVVDQSGAMVTGARVKLTGEGQSPSQEAISGGDGQFFFANVTPGPFQLIDYIGWLRSADLVWNSAFGGNRHDPADRFKCGHGNERCGGRIHATEVAEQQIKVEEKQRVLGVLPNFYVSYIPDAVPLTSKQKFKLAWKTVLDPFTLVFVGGTAGVEQAQNHFAEYGQGAQGYAKRFGANYADAATGTFIGAAILPSLLKQDPRYFYKGTGSKRSRALYAMANAFICKGDNGHWQANYSNILGSLAAGGVSNLYYPDQDRNGMGLTFENATIGLGASAVSNLFQEFVIRKLTPKVPKNGAANP